MVDAGNVAVFIIMMQISAAVFRVMGYGPRVIDAASNLAVAWIVIRLLTSMMPNRVVARGVTTVVWSVAALNIFGLLAPITEFLAGLSFTVGETTFNALGAVKGLALAAVFLQAASLAGQFADRRIQRISDLSPSLKVLTVKAVKVLLFTAAVLSAMSSVGIDLTSLAIFSSAVGVGIGFGLQTVFSNYVAGILLLMDHSIKPGDTIEVGGVFGVVNDMHARYASVLTRDGTEYPIPTEQLVSGQDANMGWTNGRSQVLLNIWRLFHEHGIEFPFPQRDVLIKPASAIAVKLEKDDGE